MEKVKAFLLYFRETNTLEIMEESTYRNYQSLTNDIVFDKIEIEFLDIKKLNSFTLIVNNVKDLSLDKKEVIIKLLNIYTALFKPKE